MSMRCSIRYWQWGPFSLHRYLHAAQPWREQSDRRTRVVFTEIIIGRWEYQLWPRSMTYNRNPWWGEPNPLWGPDWERLGAEMRDRLKASRS